MSALAALSLFLVISSGLSHPRSDRPKARPEYLDHLLKTKQYELFAEIMNIPDVSLVRPKEGERSEYPMFNKDLEMGDIVPAFGPLKEESRQIIRFDRYRGSKWPNRNIPYYIADDHFTSSQLNTIQEGVNTFNGLISCIQLAPYKGEDDYIYIFNGQGCWSYLGRIGGQQSLSLQGNGCVYVGTFVHEILHALGFAHEQNRLDRDEWIEMQWENIPEEWKSQYQKVNSRDFEDKRMYDYLSIMHYPVNAPGTGKPAFTVRVKGVDERRIGNGNNLTITDIARVNDVYC